MSADTPRVGAPHGTPGGTPEATSKAPGGVGGPADALVHRLGEAVAAGGGGELSEPALQRLLAIAVKLRAARIDAGSTGDPFEPGIPVTATEVATVVSAMLAAVGVDVFELGMWHLRGGRPVR